MCRSRSVIGLVALTLSACTGGTEPATSSRSSGGTNGEAGSGLAGSSATGASTGLAVDRLAAGWLVQPAVSPVAAARRADMAA